MKENLFRDLAADVTKRKWNSWMARMKGLRRTNGYIATQLIPEEETTWNRMSYGLESVQR